MWKLWRFLCAWRNRTRSSANTSSAASAKRKPGSGGEMMRCSRENRRLKCETRARWEASREMRWDGWHGYVFPVTCGESEKPTHGLVWKECPACGGLLPLGMGPLVDLM